MLKLRIKSIERFYVFASICVLGNNGVFFQCFNDKEELLRNMMGLVGNVAEVKHLRNRLMKSEFITVFSNLLDSDSDGIEVKIRHISFDKSYFL